MKAKFYKIDAIGTYIKYKTIENKQFQFNILTDYTIDELWDIGFTFLTNYVNLKRLTGLILVEVNEDVRTKLKGKVINVNGTGYTSNLTVTIAYDNNSISLLKDVESVNFSAFTTDMDIRMYDIIEGNTVKNEFIIKNSKR